MRKFFRFKLDRVASRKQKRPTRIICSIYNRQRWIRYAKGVHEHAISGIFKFGKFRPGSGAVARQRWLINLEGL